MKLNQILKEKGRSKVWLAKQINKTPRSVSNWAAGNSYPPLDVAKKIAFLLEVEIKDLID